jgi:hypothetical protein
MRIFNINKSKQHYLWLLIVCSLGSCSSVFSQIKIGENPKSINADAILEVESVNKGFLLPRIALVSTTVSAPLKKFTGGMVVYNTSSSNDLTPGLYYCDGTKWIKASNTTTSSSPATPSNPLNNVQSKIETVATNGQTIFKTPSVITDINKILLYRNGIMISCTLNNSNSIISEVPCKQGDQIRIIQLL